jgi:tricorn protease
MRGGRSLLLGLAVAGLLAGPAQPAGAVNTQNTRLLTQPAVSATSVAFVYAGELWVANLDGGGARRLTARVGEVSNPRFSPDGRLIAYSAQLDGNVDVWVVPAAGGEPRRLTWHPGADRVQDFTPDGRAVLFTSPREVYTTRHTQLFTAPVDGGMPARLPIPHASRAAYSPNGARIAYVPLPEAFRQWKNYRGGETARIWLYDVATHAVEAVPQPSGRCNDTDPMWIGGTVYFLSDRAGEFNLFAYDPASKKVEQLTRHADFPVQDATAGAGRIVYEQAGTLHLFDPTARATRALAIGVAADLPETRPRWASGAKWIRDMDLSPSGARAVFEFRGEIVTVPAEKGDPRNLTNTPGAHERSPAWSPDGARIAYFSDASGEYTLKVEPQDGKGEVKTFPLGGAGFYENPKWSPDATKLAFTDNSRSLYWIDLAGGAVKKISSEKLYSPGNTLSHAWSPDSKWIAYTRNTMTNFQQVHLYSLEQDRSFPITDGLADVGEPVFDAGGKYLYFFGSTDAGPVRDWFAMSNADMTLSGNVYLAVLAKGAPSPLAKESDEEKGKIESDKTKAEAGDKSKPETAKGKDGDKDAIVKKTDVKVVIDVDGLAQRIVPLPPKAAALYRLQAGEAGTLFYLRRDSGESRFRRDEATTLVKFDLAKREETTLTDKVDDFVISADGKKVLYQQKENYFIAETKGKIEGGKGKLAVDAISVRVEPRAEWAEMFADAWRINRDYFYDPGMHGANWPAMRAKYEQFLPDLSCRADLARVIQWMCSELSVGHHRGGGGDTGEEPKKVGVGLLGADYEIANGRYRFARVFGGLNWNPELRAPLTEPGVDVKTGLYLLAVAGREIVPPEEIFSRFENTVGKIVEITVATDAKGGGSRTVKVVPIADEATLRNRDWVEGNIRKVDAATGGRVAYVYVPNTSTLGHTYFKRYFFPQADKQAIIVDERHNGGGQVADYYIDALRRPFISMWATRYGADLPTPRAAIQGPKVMLIDETAGSGGDLLPWMFRKLGLGPLVGRRTWGGLVGILGFPVLMDGGTITAPNLAIWTENGWVVENEGVPPDVEVEQLPEKVIAGHDPQLEKAIEIALAELAKNPPTALKRPPFPVRVRK